MGSLLAPPPPPIGLMGDRLPTATRLEVLMADFPQRIDLHTGNRESLRMACTAIVGRGFPIDRLICRLIPNDAPVLTAVVQNSTEYHLLNVAVNGRRAKGTRPIRWLNFGSHVRRIFMHRR